MWPRSFPSRLLAAPLLVALALVLAVGPQAVSAPAGAVATSGHVVATAATRSQETRSQETRSQDARSTLSLAGDVAQHSAARSRRGAQAWPGRKILYTETIPTKWDWSLSTAIAKWNSAGGRIRFVRTTNPRKAKLKIQMGNLGGAAGMATVGRTKRASVWLSTVYSGVDALDARNRVQVMGIFTHELGHVLGFEHTTARCSLMSPVLDIDGCQTLPATRPGYYSCHTIDAPLAARFVRVYGGRTRYPGSYCPIDPLPGALSRVAFTGGSRDPVTVRWARPAVVPAGSRVEIRARAGATCTSAPETESTHYASVSAESWHDLEWSGSTCYRVQLVNRYGAGGGAVSRLIS